MRGQRPRGGPAFETHRTVHSEELSPTLADSSADLRFAAAVAGAADILRGNGAASEFSLARAFTLAQSAAGSSPERMELVSLLAKAIALHDQSGAVAQRRWDNSSPY